MNDGHDFEENPNSISMRINVVYAPQIETVSISKVLANNDNNNWQVVGRGEVRILTFYGTYFKTAEVRNPFCLFTQVCYKEINDSQRLVSIYQTSATVVSDFKIQCQTP